MQMPSQFGHVLIALLFLAITSDLCAQKPNFIVILVDDMGYSDIGCMGGPVQTPHLDGLASSGILFNNYRTYPKCMPTRNALMTGMDDFRKKEDSITIAEALKPEGYGTYFVGKAHGKLINDTKTALKRGFDRTFGNSAGGNFWDHTTRQTMLDGEPWDTDQPFYKTDVHTDYALQFLDENGTENPFFLYLAYHAPHYPIQAKPETIDQYRGQFMDGPSALRKKRFARMQDLGLITEGTQLSPDFTEMENAWDSLPQEKKVYYDQVMAGYCAMIDSVDENVGRVLQKLKEMGVREKTVLFFASDNGGCAEGGEGIWPGYKTERFGRKYQKEAEFGSADSHWQVGQAWTNLSNTPLREWKNISHEGGLSVPLIINAPQTIKDPGKLNEQPVMVMDVMPTILDLAGVSYPETFEGKTLKPMRGVSIQPLLAGQDQELTRPFMLYFSKTTSYIHYPWKIVQKGKKEPWELYDLEKDRSELNDLASEMPDQRDALLAEMKAYRAN